MRDIVAITGAGISKASGIPTFEEMGDLRNKLSRDYFNNHPEDFYEALLNMKMFIDKAEPNPAHLALAEYRIPIITMNIDGLHKKAGSKEVLEVHGNLEYLLCKRCKDIYDFHTAEQSIYCPKCGEIYEPNVVLYGDSIRSYFEAIELVESCKRVLVIGTSFYTSTVNDFVLRAKMADIQIDIINKDAETEVPKYILNYCNKNKN